MTERRRSPGTGAFVHSLRRHLDDTALLPPGSPVVVALSGGLDSTVLLHLFRFPLASRTGPITAAHLDHAMRPTSEGDARWLSGLCRAWDIELVMERAPTPPRSEAEARRLRYAFLERVAPPGVPVATAHHADDQAETVLFRLARGTGLRGLRGIAPRRGRLIRPLLPFRRAELEAYGRAAGLGYREDPTNVELHFARNRIRHRILPELERVRPGAARALAALADEARLAELAWDQILDRMADELVVGSSLEPPGLSLAAEGLRAYHPQLRARLLRHLLRRHGPVPGRAGTRAALEFITSGPSGGSLHLPSGVRLERDFDWIRIVAAEAVSAEARTEEDQPLEIGAPTPGAGRATVGGRRLLVEWGASSGAVVGDGAVVAEPRFPLLIRGWRPGDRIRLSYGTKKLKKLLAERRLGRRDRARTAVLVDGAGLVLWVVGVARADGVRRTGDGFHIAVRDAE